MKQQAVIILAIVFAAAERIFTNHKNIDEIYMTSDGQGFTDESKADDHARYLADKTVKKYSRGEIEQVKKPEPPKKPELPKAPEGDLDDNAPPEDNQDGEIKSSGAEDGKSKDAGEDKSKGKNKDAKKPKKAQSKPKSNKKK